jgi:phosphoglycolate phosphatase
MGDNFDKFEKNTLLYKLYNFLRRDRTILVIKISFCALLIFNILDVFVPENPTQYYSLIIKSCLSKAQKITESIFILLFLPLIFTSIYSVENGIKKISERFRSLDIALKREGSKLIRPEKASILLKDKLENAENVKAVAYNMSNFSQVFLRSMDCFEKQSLSVLIRHPGAPYIIPENPGRDKRIRNQIETSISNFGALSCKEMRVRGYFLEPNFRGLILDDLSGFLSFYKVEKLEDRAYYPYNDTYKYHGTNNEGWLVSSDGTPEEKLILEMAKKWFDAAWSTFSLPILPEPVLIFDFDETIADTADINFKTWEEVLNPQNVMFDEKELRSWIKTGISSDEILEKLNFKVNEGLLLKDKRERQKQELINKESVLFPEVKKVLKELSRRGYKMGIASSNSKEVIIKCLKNAGVYNFFDVILGRSEDFNKPSKKVLEFVAKSMKCNLDRLIFIGNGWQDAETAKNADVPCILIDRNTHIKDEPHFVLMKISDANELLNIFRYNYK